VAGTSETSESARSNRSSSLATQQELLEKVVEKDSAYSQEFPKLHSQPQKTPKIVKTKKRPAIRTQVVSPSETTHSRSTQPYESSYFLPGKISGKAAAFLPDTGCTTNQLSRRLFGTLSARVSSRMKVHMVRWRTDRVFLSTASLHYLDASVIRRFTRRSLSAI